MLTMQFPVSIFRSTWRLNGKGNNHPQFYSYYRISISCKYSTINRCKGIQQTMHARTQKICLVTTAPDSNSQCSVRLFTHRNGHNCIPFFFHPSPQFVPNNNWMGQRHYSCIWLQLMFSFFCSLSPFSVSSFPFLIFFTPFLAVPRCALFLGWACSLR